MRAHNFGAGPCTLPLDVLEEAREEFLDFAGTGMSILEMSHRSPEYEAVHNEALSLARQVGEAPDDFEVLLVQGGATLQFSMVAMNLLRPQEKGAYVVSGSWGKRALEDAKPHGEVYAAWDGEQAGYTTMPESTLEISPATRYLHVTSNETIGGIRMVDFPRPGVPMVADMSSDYLSRPLPWDLFDLVYGGVQKNLAPAGMAVVYIRKRLLEDPPPALGSYLRYDWHAKSNSLGNTPPMFPIYLMGKVLRRMEAAGGVRAMEKLAAEKAGRLYQTIDRSEGFYRNPVDSKFRSHHNVVFRLPEPSLEGLFVKEAEARNMIGLKGHRSVGGCRASLYAALPMDSVEALSEFMTDFARRHRAL